MSDSSFENVHVPICACCDQAPCVESLARNAERIMRENALLSGDNIEDAEEEFETDGCVEYLYKSDARIARENAPTSDADYVSEHVGGTYVTEDGDVCAVHAIDVEEYLARHVALADASYWLCDPTCEPGCSGRCPS